MNDAAIISKLTGRAVPVRGNDIDTDRIIPARFLRCVVFDGLGPHSFEDDRLGLKAKGQIHPFDDGRFQGSSILFVNKNFGCGSSREHAPQALNRFGIKAIVGESFAAIFAGNCNMMGVPTVTVSEKDIQQLMKSVQENPKTQYTVDIENKTLTYGNVKIDIDMPETYRTGLLMGSWDSTALLRANLDQVKQTAKKLPYMNNFAG